MSLEAPHSRPTLEERLDKLEPKIDRLLFALDKFAPLLDRLMSSKGVFNFKRGGNGN